MKRMPINTIPKAIAPDSQNPMITVNSLSLDKLRHRASCHSTIRRRTGSPSTAPGQPKKGSRRAYVFRIASDSCPRRVVPALAFSATSGHQVGHCTTTSSGDCRRSLSGRKPAASHHDWILWGANRCSHGGPRFIRATVSRRQLAIAACHGGGEHREQEEQGRFRPEVAADATDGVRRRSKSGIAFQRIAPANYRNRWDN